MKKPNWITIGQLAKRTGAAVSAIRFYEEKGLLMAYRTNGGTRKFLKSDIRRVSFILIAQRLGYSLDEIGIHLKSLPSGRTPTKKDWEKISRKFQQSIDERIDGLKQMRDRLTGCIGCGCLSLKTCALYNHDDTAAIFGPGPRYLMGNAPSKKNITTP